ncbi:hypothetical protein [Cohaesibacter intestini]|uniref:hypothetical protein n=1 Tax=Cohaesibacter intestini TaxID=2211145 RepID=UPI000DEA716E|nr:hypothetical protein [Cohaesibacter intestini]
MDRRKEIGSRSHGVREARRRHLPSHWQFFQDWADMVIWVRLSPAAAALITELFLDCRNGDYDPIPISIAEAMEKTRASRDVAIAALKELVRYGWLDKRQDGTLKGPVAHRVSIYQLIPPPHERQKHFPLLRQWRSIPAWQHLSNEGRKLFITMKAKHPYRAINRFPVDSRMVEALLGCRNRKAKSVVAELVEKGFLRRAGSLHGQKAFSFTDMPQEGEKAAANSFKEWKPEIAA